MLATGPAARYATTDAERRRPGGCSGGEGDGLVGPLKQPVWISLCFFPLVGPTWLIC